jgi:hypothetical protein
MSRLPIRAALFALLALVLTGVLSAIALLIVVGVPDPKAGAAASDFVAQAAPMARTVDMIVGAVVMLLLGWLAARPFAGRDALLAGALVAIFYLVLDFAVIAFSGGLPTIDYGAVLTSHAVKIAAALLGGAIASRSGAPA